MRYIIFIMVIFLSSCSSKKETVFPINFFEIEALYYQKWLGGRPEAGKGINVMIVLKTPIQKPWELKKVIFQNQETIVIQESDKVYKANVIVTKNDFILHDSPEKEYNNEPVNQKFPLELFFYNENTKASKSIQFENIPEKTTVAMPSKKKK